MQFPIPAMLPIVLATFFSLIQGLPTALDPNGLPSTIQQLTDAVNNWQADTATVSHFLSTVPTLSGTHLACAAQIALKAENDELLHKKVLDENFSSDNRIVGANDVLVNQGTFQSVVDALGKFATNGAKMSSDEISALLHETNRVRCGQVLPAIDTYFLVAGENLDSSSIAVAPRPTNCP